MVMPPLPFTCPVNGVSFHQDVIITLKIEQKVLIMHDVKNEYDKNACKVLTLDNEHLGYLPKNIAKKLTCANSERQKSFRWEGRIVEILTGETWGIRVKIEKAYLEERTEIILKIDGMPKARQVKSRSGRILGEFVAEDTLGSKVLVKNRQGHEISFSKDLVTIEDN